MNAIKKRQFTKFPYGWNYKQNKMWMVFESIYWEVETQLIAESCKEDLEV